MNNKSINDSNNNNDNNKVILPRYILKYVIRKTCDDYYNKNDVVLKTNKSRSEMVEYYKTHSFLVKLAFVCKSWLQALRDSLYVVLDSHLYYSYQLNRDKMIRDYDPNICTSKLSNTLKQQLQRVLLVRHIGELNGREYSIFDYKRIRMLVMHNDDKISNFLNLVYHQSINNHLVLEAVRSFPSLDTLFVRNFHLSPPSWNYIQEAKQRRLLKFNSSNGSEGYEPKLQVLAYRAYVNNGSTLSDIEKLKEMASNLKVIQFTSYENSSLVAYSIKTFYKTLGEVIVAGNCNAFPFRELGNVGTLVKYTNSKDVRWHLTEDEFYNQPDDRKNYLNRITKFDILCPAFTNIGLPITDIYYALRSLSILKHFSFGVCFYSLNYYLSSYQERNSGAVVNCKCGSLFKMPIKFFDRHLDIFDVFSIYWDRITQELNITKVLLKSLEVRHQCTLDPTPVQYERLSNNVFNILCSLFGQIPFLEHLVLSNFSDLLQDYIYLSINDLRHQLNKNIIKKKVAIKSSSFFS